MKYNNNYKVVFILRVMADDVMTCSKNCCFYLYQSQINLCNLVVDESLSAPYCYDSAHIGSPCRWKLNKESVQEFAKSRLEKKLLKQYNETQGK